MRYLLRTDTSYEHLAKKFKRAVSVHVGRDGSKMAVCTKVFYLFALFSEREWPLRAR